MRQRQGFVSRAESYQGQVWLHIIFVVFGVLFVAFAPSALAQDDGSDETLRDEETARPAEDPQAPRRHFRIANPNRISDDEAEEIYAELKERMATGYRISGLPGATDYQTWTRYNTSPYRSAAHGNRYVNNFANDIARSYGEYEQGGILPVGSIIAKDNVTVTAEGTASAGALLLMEKMPEGFNYISGNWRYTMVMPDGSVFGVTNGDGANRVKFCITCHLAAERDDHLFFMPKEYRR